MSTTPPRREATAARERAGQPAHVLDSRRGIQLLVGVVAVSFAPVVAGVLAFRSLGEEGRGEMAVLLVTATVAGLVGARGLDAAYLGGDSDAPDAGGLLACTNRRLIGIALFEAPIAALIAALIVDRFSVVRCLAVWAFTLGSADYIMSKMSQLKAGQSSRVLTADLAVASVTALGGCVIYLNDGQAAGYVLAASAGFLTASILVRARTGRPLVTPTASQRETMRDLARPLFLSRSLVLVAFRTDRLVLGAVAGLSAAGVYAAAIPVAEVIALAPLHLAQLSTVDIAERSGSRWWSTRPAQIGLTVAVGLTLVVLWFASPLIQLLYASRPSELVRTVRILAVASLAGGVWRLAEAELVANQLVSKVRMPAMFAAAAVIIVTLIGSQRFGAIAPAVGSLIGYSGAAIWTLALVRHSDRHEHGSSHE